MNIYHNGFIYKDYNHVNFGRADHWNTESEAEHNAAFEAFMQHLNSFVHYPVQGEHKWVNFEDVTGRYELVDELAIEVDEYGNLVCNVEGCDQLSCSGGNHYMKTGYWCLCTKHAHEARQGNSQPKMKDKAIEHEAARDKETGYSTQRITALPLAQPVQPEECQYKDDIAYDILFDALHKTYEEPERHPDWQVLLKAMQKLENHFKNI